MYWLLICNDEKKLQAAETAVRDAFGEQKVCRISQDKNLLKEFSMVKSAVTHCIVSAEKMTEALEFAVGWLCGAGVPVITDIHELDKRAELFETVLTKNDFSGISAYLQEHKDAIAAAFQKKEAFRYLFEHGLPFTADCFAGYIEKGKIDLCRQYVRAGMSVDARDSDGTPMLNIACRCENCALAEWLVSCGCDIDPVSEDRGYTPLMDAVWKGNLEIASFLIQHGADVNRLSKDGQTMIVLAVGADKLDLCRLLAENGADVDIPDAMGMSAYGYAKLFKKNEILSVLEKYHKE